MGAFLGFFSHLSGWRTADPADLLVSRQQIEAGRGCRVGGSFPCPRWQPRGRDSRLSTFFRIF